MAFAILLSLVIGFALGLSIGTNITITERRFYR